MLHFLALDVQQKQLAYFPVIVYNQWPTGGRPNV